MAPRRWGPAALNLIRAFLVERDGPNCALCHAEPTETLQIDHVDNDHSHDTTGNLRLLCQSCNLARRPRNDRGTFVCVSEPQPKLSATDQAHLDLPYTEGSPEMQASTYFTRRFRAWVLDNLPMTKEEAINGGAEVVGCSTETAKRNLSKLTSRVGPVAISQDINGKATLILKEDTTWRTSGQPTPSTLPKRRP